ncbi:short coiled-coil protein B [Planococcus citri]|uniref:short coiled-coil protein B n=1 Tax=Planococcus citri TaxID=170843 RepID=UPI0031F8DF92
MDTSKTITQEEMNSIPLVDDDPQLVVQDDNDISQSSDILQRNHSIDSIPSTFTNESSSPSRNNFDSDISPDELEEKARLITQVLELQNTLDDLSHRVDSVKDETLKLRSENQVLGQYIENLMSASSVFQSTSPKPKKK